MVVDHSTVEQFGESLRRKGKQPATVESYCRDAQRFLEYIGKYRLAPGSVVPDTLLSYQDYLKSDCEERDNSVRRTVIGVRQFFRFLTDIRHIQSTPFDSVPIPMRDESLPRSLEDDDIESLLAIAESGRPTFKAARDAAMVALLAYEGIKANEMISLRWNDFLPAGDRGILHIGNSRKRAIHLSPLTFEYLSEYKVHYDALSHPVIRNAPVKRMFIAFKGRDAASPLPEMTRHGLKFVLYEIGEKAGLKHLNTELLRHFAVSNLVAHGKSAEDIMAHLGLKRLGNIAKHLSRSRSSLKSEPLVLQGASST